MLLTIALVLLVLWALGLLALPVLGSTVHIVLVIALIVVCVHVVRGGRVLP